MAWYLVISRQVASDAVKEQHFQAHHDWLLDQHRAGRVLASGPNADRNRGIYILRAASRAEAEELAAQDPYHAYGDRQMELLEWQPQRYLRLDGETRVDLAAWR